MKSRILIIIVVLAVAAAGYGFYQSKKSSDTVKIGGIYILTGPISAFGELEHRGTELAVSRINASGGINGKKLEVVEEDSAYDPKRALDAYNALKARGIKFFIVDGSGVAAAVRKPVIDDGGFVMVPAATTPVFFDGDNRSCRIALTARNFGPGLADLLIQRNYKKASFLFPGNEYGKGLGDEFVKAYVVRGGKVTTSEFYDASPAGGDYRTNITKLKAKEANTDALVFIQPASTVEPMLKQIHELGWKKPVLTDHYTIENPALKNLSLANGIEFVDYEYSFQDSAVDNDVARKFKEDYRRTFNSDPTYVAAATYDAVTLVADAMRKIGEDTQKVADYVSSLKEYSAITGSLSFNSDCEVQRKTVVRKIENGRIADIP